MTATTEDRDSLRHDGYQFSAPVAAATTFRVGTIAALDASGDAVEGSETAGLVALGVSREHVDNSAGAAGDEKVEIDARPHGFENSSGGDEITRAEIGDLCYIVDNQTVAKTDNAGARSVAGRILDVKGTQVIVGFVMALPVDAGLVAANNLSDVSNAATARANIGANEVPLYRKAEDLSGTAVYRAVAPVAGDISKIWSVLEGSVDAEVTLTVSINGVNVTSGVVTIASGGAAGEVDSATPSGANTVAKGDVVEITVGDGTNTVASAAMVSMLIET